MRLASVPFVQLWRHHDARCLNLGVFFHSLSMVGEQVVLGWFILELTNSALMVGVALVASSSWSHAFLTPKHHLLYPDVEADRALYDKLRVGDYERWRQTPLAALEESGQQEMLNWMCLAGAMSELGRRTNDAQFVQTYIFNSSKVFADRKSVV